MPSRVLSSEKIEKGESRSKRGNEVFEFDDDDRLLSCTKIAIICYYPSVAGKKQLHETLLWKYVKIKRNL